MTIERIFHGRMNRLNFLFSQGVLMVVVILTGLFLIRNGIDYSKLDALIVVLVIGFAFQFLCAYRRVQDLNYRGLWALLMFIPYVSLPFFLYISYKAGDALPNQYGNPDTRSLMNSILNK